MRGVHVDEKKLSIQVHSLFVQATFKKNTPVD